MNDLRLYENHSVEKNRFYVLLCKLWAILSPTQFQVYYDLSHIKFARLKGHFNRTEPWTLLDLGAPHTHIVRR